MPKIVNLKNLSRHFKMAQETVRAINNITLDIEDGNFVALVGPSGSGKSTLLNLIGGLDTPTEGEIVVDNVKQQGSRLGFDVLDGKYKDMIEAGIIDNTTVCYNILKVARSATSVLSATEIMAPPAPREPTARSSPTPSRPGRN